jgi:hypothetical protein
MELPLGCTPQGNIELMPKKEILKLNSAPRLEQVGDNCPKQMEHRNHRVDDELILPYRANRPDGIFGNDSRRIPQKQIGGAAAQSSARIRRAARRRLARACSVPKR